MTSPAGHNLPPIPVLDHHDTVRDHEALAPNEILEIQEDMLKSADDFEEWSDELRNLNAQPVKTAEDNENREKLAGIFDREPVLLDAEPAGKTVPIGERIRSEDTRGLLRILGELADNKPESVASPSMSDKDAMNTREFAQLKATMAGMGMGDDASVLENYRRIHGDEDNTALKNWEKRKEDAILRATELLNEDPDQSLFFIAQGEAYKSNLDQYYTQYTAHGQIHDPRLVKTSSAHSNARQTLATISNNPHVPDNSLEAAGVRVTERDTRTAHGAALDRAEASKTLHDNYQELLKELPLDFDDGEKAVIAFQKQYERANGHKLEDAVDNLKTGETFKAFLEADPADRARAEQPLWRDIQYTGRALSNLHNQLATMRNSGMSTAHSHYRALYEKAREVEDAHVSSWQRWQSLRMTHATQRNFYSPDFEGRARTVFFRKDSDKGMYVEPPRGSGTTIVYPDNSIRKITTAGGTTTIGERANLDGSKWKAPEPLELTYEEVAPYTNTGSMIGNMALRTAAAAGRETRRIDNRDSAELGRSLDRAELAWRLNPADPTTVRNLYDVTRIYEQRISETISRMTGDGATPLTPAQQTNLDQLRAYRGQMQARARFLEHGSAGNISTLGYDGSVSFRGNMYEGNQGDWRVVSTGHAAKKQYKRNPGGGVITTEVWYRPDGSVI